MNRFERVFALVPDCHSAGHYGDLWRRHIYEGLRDVVKELVLPAEVNFDWARPALRDTSTAPPEKTVMSRKLLEQITAAHRRARLDAVISHCYSQDLDLDVVRATIRLGVPWINFFCDSVHSFARVEELARAVSLNWFPEISAIPKYRGLTVPYCCKPYALNPAFLPDLRCRTPEHPVVFIGVPIPQRILQLGALRLRGVPVQVRGPGWSGGGQTPFQARSRPVSERLAALCRANPAEKIARRLAWVLIRKQTGPSLNAVEFNEFLQHSQMILGLNEGRDDSGRWTSYLKFRDLEFPGYGCAYLTGGNAEIEELFKVGEEILTYRDMGDAARTIRAIRGNTERLVAIGERGRRRVLREHTWDVRVRQLAEALNS